MQPREQAPSQKYSDIAFVGGRQEADGADVLEVDILRELEPLVEQNLNRHLATPDIAAGWKPHDYIPYDEGRNYAALGGEDWRQEQSKLSPGVRTAMLVNLLTEDNLPAYHRTIMSAFGKEGAWPTWANRWTAEEGRHSIAMRDYLVVTRGVDPDKLEQLRLEHMVEGYEHETADTPLKVLAYVSFQEMATRISHRNTGTVSGDPILDKLLGRIAKDENHHMIFYRNLVAGAFEIAPDATMEAVADQVIHFQMPGHGIPDFQRQAAAIARENIYNLPQHLGKVLEPVIKAWNVRERSDLSARGEQAREKLLTFLGGLSLESEKFTASQERLKARRIARGLADA